MNVIIVTSIVVLVLSAAVTFYAYFGYPALLWAYRALRGERGERDQRGRRSMASPRDDLERADAEPFDWPPISITLPAYNAERTLRPVLEGLVRVDYPRDRRQILVVSDGSTDGTDDLVREFASQGVDLLR